MRVACSSFNKKSNNAQGGQSRVNPSPVNSTESNSASAARTIHNGTHVQSQLHGKLYIFWEICDDPSLHWFLVSGYVVQ